MRVVALCRKNYLFVGSESGGRAIAYALIETTKLNTVDPQARLADTLARIPDYKITKVADLQPPLCATKSETFDCLKFTLEGSGERSDGNARTSGHALARRA